MNDGLRQKVESINKRLAKELENAQGVLRGSASFGAKDVRALQALLSEMEPVITRSAELRQSRPEIAEQLDLYKAQLLELQKTMEQVRVTLLVQRASLAEKRVQVNAASHWCDALQRMR
ncbi:MAG TPA: hypothetical protein VMU53_02580 [Candidatus Sulfotelmatobacter sp.]|nr:hypothetical protein [Candidatus Sulfotelmatobacter sp.]